MRENRLFEMFVFGVGFRIYKAQRVDRKSPRRPPKQWELASSLLEDIRRVLDTSTAQGSLLPGRQDRFIRSSELMDRLKNHSGKWKNLSYPRLARSLRAEGIQPRSHRVGGHVFKGYVISDLLERANAGGLNSP